MTMRAKVFLLVLISTFLVITYGFHFGHCLKTAGVTGKLDISSRMLVCRRMGGVGGWDYDDYDPDQAFEAYKGSMDEDMVTIGKKSEGDSRGDDEILEEMREKRMLQNDLWQFGTFGDLCEDDWHGYWTEYEASGGGGGGNGPGGKGEGQEAEEGGSSFRLAPAAGPPGLVVTSTARRDGKGRQIDQDCELAITYDDKDGLLGSFKDCLRSKLVPIDFRGVNGNLVNKNIYSFSQVGKGSITIELAIVENELADAQHRMRVILGYTEEEGTSRHRLARAFVCREARGGAAAAARAASGGAPPLYGEVGTGIYDIPRASSPEDYYTIYEEGLLTVRFPAVVRTEDFGAITLDWAPSDIRYQVDRTFKRFDGSAHTLGVIEISAENAKTYTPEFPKQ